MNYIQFLCQWTLVILLIIAFFVTLKKDFDGSKGAPPEGFIGAIGTILTITILFLVYLGAGAFSLIFK